MRYDKLIKCYYGHSKIIIREVLYNYIDFFSDYSILFVSIDSTPHTARENGWINNLRADNTPYEIYNGNLWFDKNTANKIISENPFCGYDEIYLFKNKPLLVPGDLEEFQPFSIKYDQEMPEEFIKQFIGLGAQRYLCDGDGLNYVCEDSATAQIIENLGSNKD
jgi:hypothetical protein